MTIATPPLSATGLQRFQELRSEAIDTVTGRFYTTHGLVYDQFGLRGREACREDLAFHLEFLRPVLEFGIVQPMVDYLRWLASVLASRDVPVKHLALSLDWLAEFFAAAMEGPDGATIVAALHDTKTRYLETDEPRAAIYGMMPKPWPESVAFEGALLAGDRHSAGAIFERCLDEGHNLVDAELHIIQPALYNVGLKWQNNQVTVVQEHLATAISQTLMAQGLLKSTFPESNGRKVLIACVAGNQHSVGSQMVADAFQLAGWDVQFLGADVPTTALIKHVDQWKPELLGLSVSFVHQLRVVKAIMLQLMRSHGTGRPSVIVGGLAINQFHPLADALGADAWSPDAHAAVARASKFIAQADAG